MAIKHTIRSNGSGKTKEVLLTPIKAIRCHCIECMGFQLAEIPKCTAPLCSLFPFKMGNAHTGKNGSKKSPAEGTLAL
jgi:hypothetical protein